jgi:hypothetical protein
MKASLSPAESLKSVLMRDLITHRSTYPCTGRK